MFRLKLRKRFLGKCQSPFLSSGIILHPHIEWRSTIAINLPGWRWAAITKVALDRLSRSLHSDVCDSDGCCDAVVHSTISGSGNRRTRAVPNIPQNLSNPIFPSQVGSSKLPAQSLCGLFLFFTRAQSFCGGFFFSTRAETFYLPLCIQFWAIVLYC